MSLLGAGLEPEAEPLGCAALDELLLLGEALEPPEAAPDFDASLEPEAPPLTEDDAEPEGAAALPEGDEVAPAELEEPEGEVDGDAVLELAEPEGDVDGEVALLELEPGADEDLVSLPRSHAARPKASATAAARV